MLRFKRFQPRQRANDGVLNEILGIVDLPGPLRQPAPRPSFERRQRALDEQADGRLVTLLESFEQIDSAGQGHRRLRFIGSHLASPLWWFAGIYLIKRLWEQNRTKGRAAV